MIMMMYDCGLETKINLFIKNKISANNKKNGYKWVTKKNP